MISSQYICAKIYYTICVYTYTMLFIYIQLCLNTLLLFPLVTIFIISLLYYYNHYCPYYLANHTQMTGFVDSKSKIFKKILKTPQTMRDGTKDQDRLSRLRSFQIATRSGVLSRDDTRVPEHREARFPQRPAQLTMLLLAAMKTLNAIQRVSTVPMVMRSIPCQEFFKIPLTVEQNILAFERIPPK